MAYALIYTAKSSGKTSYWANPGFTGNSKRKYTWEKPGEIHFALDLVIRGGGRGNWLLLPGS